VCWRNSKWWCSAAPQPRHGRQPTRARPKKDGEARRRNFPRPPGSTGTSRRPRHRAPRKPTRGPPPPRLPGATDGNHGESTGTGGGPAAPTHENKSGGQLPATSPTASAISFLPTVQQRGRVGHLQSPRHRTISWNGVYQEESRSPAATSAERAFPVNLNVIWHSIVTTTHATMQRSLSGSH
jgi:hypothetical protein